jgi:heme O synthase-like polyprenyltransferase
MKLIITKYFDYPCERPSDQLRNQRGRKWRYKSMQHTAPIVIFLLVLFGIYRRTRRTIGFQKFIKSRMLIKIIFLAVIGVIFIVMGFLNPRVYIFDAIGIMLGGIISYYAIRTTSFERRKDAWFYRSNPWIGFLLVVLFVGRIAYRVFQEYALFSTSASANGQIATQSGFVSYSHDPISAIILFTLITYYVLYYTLLIRRKPNLETNKTGSSGN